MDQNNDSPISVNQKNLNIIEKAVSDENIPKLYANGFSSALGNGDAVIVFLQNGSPNFILNLSYTMAKTLALKLGGMINDLEDKTSNTIMITDDIGKALE